MAKGRMPDGTHPPSYIAKSIEVRRPVTKPPKWDAAGVKAAGERKTLLQAVRAGEPAAIKRLAQEYRARIWWEYDV